MLRLALLLSKRLFILLLGLLLVWFTVFNVYPFADDRLPWAIAVLATYCFVAYIGLPALLRIWQALHRHQHVPTRTQAADGWAVDPINLVILAKNKKELMWALQKAGWHLADEPTVVNRLRLIYAVLFNRPYPNAPFGTYYVFGRKQDMGFQMQLSNSPRHRHHIRFWRLGTTMLDGEHEHHGFWRKLLKNFLTKQKGVWVGAAILDRGINVRWRNLQIDHGVDSNTVAERDFAVHSLRHAGVLKDAIGIKAGEPLRTRHQGLGETIIADGYVKLCELKRQFLPPMTK